VEHLQTSEYVEFAAEPSPREAHTSTNEAHTSGVAWGAVIGGAFVIAALYLILLALGAGLGLSAISPWSNDGVSASAAGSLAIVWLIFIEVIASALGGYLTGRLRTKWTIIHTDEVYFRDTANGFLAWAVALLISVIFLTTAAGFMVGRAAQTAATADAAAASPNAYFVDTLFRSGRVGVENADREDRSAPPDAGRIFANAIRQNQMPPADRSYLARVIAARTGINQSDAEQRVNDVFADAQQAEDRARKATAHLLLWLFLALLMGAFSASLSATMGGRQRDQVRLA
jgi:hypothetical protein